MTADGGYADLGEIVAGARAGRTNSEQIFIFDSTGTALQDAASALAAYERARADGVGVAFGLAAEPLN